MPSEFPVVQINDALNEAGWVGKAAIGALGLFILPGTGPGTLSSTNQGFVWTKSLLTSTTAHEFDLGIGKLKMEGAALSVSLAFQLKDGIPSFIDIMITFLGEGLTPSVYLEIDKKIAVLADKIVQPPTADPPPAGEVIIGYQNAGDPLIIPFPNGAIEFNIRFIAEQSNVFATMQLYGGLEGILQMASGIIQLDLNRVVVFPKLGGLGLYIDRLFIDLTESGTTSFAGMFPEVYDPSWKGIGAADITFLFPIDVEEKEFITAGVKGFLLGFDGQFSGSFNFNYTNPTETARIKYVNSELEIRNNEFLRAEMHLGFDLKRAMEKVDPNATDSGSINTSGTADDQHLAGEAQGKLDEQRPNISFGGLIDARVDFVWHRLNDEEILGFDIIMEGIAVNGAPSGLIFGGNTAKMLFWIAGLGFGVSVLRKGIDADNEIKKVTGITLLLLVLADIVKATWEGTPLLPQLETLTIQKLGFRYVHVSKDDGTVVKYYEVILGWRLDFTINSILIKALDALGSFLLGTLGFAGDLFGESLDKIRIKGEIDLEMDNLTHSTHEIPAEINVLFEQRDLHIRAKKLPEILFDEEAASPSHIPKPMGAPELVTRPIDATHDQYGVAIKLTGLTSADFTLQTPAEGVVIFFYPEWGFELLPQTTVLPKFTFVMPHLLLAEGLIDLNKPLPSFGATQNHITLDVGIGYKSTENNMKQYLKLDNYQYQFGGEVAWGDATSDATDPARKYGFLFVEVHYASDTPLFSIGTVGVNGLGLLFGKNIRPGIQGGDNNALGIANWILGKRAQGNQDEEIFKNVRHWPDIPAADGSTWHPAIQHDAGTNDYHDYFTFGFTVKGCTTPDAGATAIFQGIGLFGFPEWWLALGAIVTLKKINAELIVVIVIDADSFLLKAIFEMKIDQAGSYVRAIVPLEVGVVHSSPEHTWVYVGHYLEAKGSPITGSFWKGLFTAKGYLDFDTDGLFQFGLVPIGEFARPDITGWAIGVGLILQFGPKRLGPSSVNITLFGALGINAALASEPRLIFGEIFIGGYVQLKVLFVKAKFELLLILNGMKTDLGHRFAGLFMVRLNMPWPIPDWKYETDFVMQTDDFLPLPDPIVSSSAAGLYRMQATALELGTPTPVVLPIDAAIAISFTKPIYGITDDIGNETDTSLLLNDEDPTNDKISEIVETDYQGLKYIIHYTHTIESITLMWRPLNGNLGILLPEVPASWDVPMLYEGGEPDPDAEAHHTLFLNSFMPPHLQFSGEQMGEFNSWSETTDHIFPCEYPGLYCVNRDPRPVLTADPVPTLLFSTPYGVVEIRDDGISEDEEQDNEFNSILGWTTTEPFNIIPAYKTFYDLPFPDRVHLRFSLFNTKPSEQAAQLATLITELKMEFAVKLRHDMEAVSFNLSLRVDTSTSCGWAATITGLNVDPALLTVNLTNNACAGSTFAFVMEFNSTNVLYPIDFIKSKGLTIVLAPALMSGNQSSFADIARAYSLLSVFRLELSNLCIEDTHHPSLVWTNTTIGTNEDGLDGVDNLTNHLLFEPASEYTVSCTIHSFVSTYHVGVDGTELVSEKEITLPMNPIVFQTESAPSQNIRQYIGFTYPAEGMQAPYAASLTPMLTFRYQGLILKIYKKYYGADVLIPLLVDMNGDEVQPVLKQSIEINSGGADQALEDLLSHCMSAAQDYTHLQISVWERTLLPDTRYSLQLKDEHLPETPTVPYTISFKTSRFTDLTFHVQYVQDMFTTAATEPVLSPPTFASDMASFVESIGSANQAGFDDAVEQFYLRFLGVEAGRLSPSQDQDFVSFIAGIDENNLPLTWGMIIELTEPVLGKEGVIPDLVTAYPGPDKGVYSNSAGLLLIRDVSGSRLLLFQRDGANVFIPFTGTASLALQFDPTIALKDSLSFYVRTTFSDKDPTEQDTMINDQYNELLALAGVSEAMTVVTATLNIIIPVIV